MSRKLVDLKGFSEDEIEKIDFLVFAVGYEKRSRYVFDCFSERAQTSFACVFEHGHELSFYENFENAQVKGAELFDETSSLKSTIAEHHPDLEHLSGKKILLDVSSMSRSVLSRLLAEFLDDDFFRGAEIAIVYAVAEFTAPRDPSFDFFDFTPLPQFCGWTSAPERPAVMAIGLGYEADHALGALEFLDPSATFCFFPRGEDHRFEVAVQHANDPLLTQIKPERVVKYPVSDPLFTFSLLTSLINSLADKARFVLVPMGPKIFVALCLVCQRIYGDEISVWKASGHSLDALKDVDAKGPLSGFWIKRN